MRKILLDNSSLEVSAVGYGSWRMGDLSVTQAQAAVEAAISAQINLLDTADIYGFGTPSGFGGVEALLGKVFKQSPALRNKLILATKGGIVIPTPYNSGYNYLMSAIEASLQRLHTDYVDLYQIHRPDLLAPVTETARALNEMVAAGKARHVGVSNYTVAQTRALQAHLDVPLVSVQPQFSVLHQQPLTDGTLDWCQETGAVCLAWSPLAGGAVAHGKGLDKRGNKILEVIDRLAKQHGASRTQIALAFLQKHPARVIPIIGSQKPSRIAEAVRADEFNLCRRDWYDLLEAWRGQRLP